MVNEVSLVVYGAKEEKTGAYNECDCEWKLGKERTCSSVGAGEVHPSQSGAS
jgi:hypothetical protein